MRAIATVIKGNLRKNKGVYISIFLLMFIVSLVLCSIMTYCINAKNRDSEVMEENGFGDMFAALYSQNMLEKMETDTASIVKKMKECDAVEDIHVSDVVYAPLKDCNGEEGNNSQFLLKDTDENFHYTKYDKKNHPVNTKLKKGEVSVPVCYKGLYDCQIGDTIQIGNAEDFRSYKVTSYFEDPYMGSFVMGIKTVLLSPEDFEELCDAAEKYQGNEEDPYTTAHLLSIFKKKNVHISSLAFEKKMNEASNYASYCWITLSKEQAQSYMLKVTDIFAAVLVTFCVMLLIAALIVLGHNISSSIELDYTNLGILKAVGMSNRSLRMSLIIGYLGAATAGLLIGIPCCVPVVEFIHEATLSSNGLYISCRLDPLLILSILLILTGIVGAFILLKTLKLSKVTPLKAISNGRESVHFSSVLKLPISNRALNLSLAYRQFISEKKQYAAAIFVTAILAVFMVMENGVCKWATAENLKNIFLVTEYDLRASYCNDATEKKADQLIENYSKYSKYRMGSAYMLFDDLQIYGNVTDHPEEFNSIRKGRTCKYDNEVVITKYIADEFKKEIGDKVKIKANGKEATYLISGIYESPNDMGKNFAMSYDGYKKLMKKNNSRDEILTSVYYRLEDDRTMKKIEKKMASTFQKDTDYTMEDIDACSDAKNLKMIELAIKGLTIFIYIIGVIFGIITVSIVCGKVIAREKKDYGIYKSIGFTSSKIRRQLAERFAVTAFTGTSMGIILAVLVSGPFLGSIFSSFGVYSYKFKLGVVSAIVPIVFMTVFFAICAYGKARKVKKLQPRILIAE